MSSVLVVSRIKGDVIIISENYFVNGSRIFKVISQEFLPLQFQPFYKRVDIEIQIDFWQTEPSAGLAF
jgi:hypothetical protein